MTQYRDSTTSREAGVTYHLVPAETWENASGHALYTPEAFESDGFIHCTNGLDQMLMVANLFYATDPRPFRVLALDVSAIESPMRYDDDEQLFPHIYGPLNTSAVIDVLPVSREEDGMFLTIGDSAS